MAGGSSDRCDSDAVLDQVAVAVRAIESELAADPNPDRELAAWRAYWSAKPVARRGAPPDIAHLADLFAGWLVERTRDGGSLVAALPIAREAAEQPRGDSPLARDLLEFITGFCDGSMSGEEWGRRLKKPRGSGRSRRPVKRAAVPAAVITVSTAESALRDMIRQRSGEGDAIDPRAAWEVFKAFAATAVAADPPEHLQSDLLLFEWGGGTLVLTLLWTRSGVSPTKSVPGSQRASRRPFSSCGPSRQSSPVTRSSRTGSSSQPARASLRHARPASCLASFFGSSRATRPPD
jgi:hypothetical protein